MTNNTPSVSEIAEQLRCRFLHKPFGVIRFWRFAVVRPNDQSYELVSTLAEGDRLDLGFVHASGQGRPGVLSVWAPEGLAFTEGGITLHGASRLRLDDDEAWIDDGKQYRIRTPRGEGAFDINEAVALTLEN